MAIGIWVDDTDISKIPWTAASFNDTDKYAYISSKIGVKSGRYELLELRDDDDIHEILVEPSK